MNKLMLVAIATLATAAVAPQGVDVQAGRLEQKREAAKNLHFLSDVMATRSGDERLYVLLGSGFLRALSFGEPKVFVSRWLARHPSSVVIPVSRMISTNFRTHERMETVYIWIEDGPSSLNVDMVRSGIFAADTMFDMVDNEKGLDELLKRSPDLADARAEIEAERAAAPEDRTDRLVPESDYQARIARFEEAERHARSEKLGIWSDAMKGEREAEGLR